jgi:chloride channel protein, CIC family
LFASESLAQALRQVEAYGRDGLPVLPADGTQVRGWITSASVLSAIAREIGAAPP